MIIGNMTPNQEIEREKIVHGKRWERLHDGYFSSADIARPLLEQVLHFANQSGAATVADLGGGTGTLSRLLKEQTAVLPFELINMDSSEQQLKIAQVNGIKTHKGTIESFRRKDLCPDQQPLLYMMRSVLHYLGHDALATTLKHVHKQTIPGEYFIHQTACFDSQEEAECLNGLYRMMHTEKWYPTEAQLVTLLRESGWTVVSTRPAPTLSLSAQDLQIRYALTTEELLTIPAQMPHAYPHLFISDETGFTAFLPYRIFVCINDNEQNSEITTRPLDSPSHQGCRLI
ncbi:MAG: methyltransferase domain-containing protein [Pontiellaceae bacterium]|nr:methyltransferase domain-containing protein [Pontiellaceae bacterium]